MCMTRNTQGTERRKVKQMTNGDKIRAMTDQQLAKEAYTFLSGCCLVTRTGGDPLKDCKRMEFKNGLSPCQQCALEWLQTPASKG